MLTERRLHTRYALQLPVSIQMKAETSSGVLTNISLGGLCLETHTFFGRDTFLQFQFKLGAAVVICTGRIVMVLPKDQARYMYGIAFFELGEAEAQEIVQQRGNLHDFFIKTL